jgi:transcriptional regulator with XRE-family HTH domain
MAKTFGELLLQLRTAAGLSQPVLAERAGIGVSTLRQFEYGMREPTFGTLVRLARALGVSLAEFDDAATDQAAGPTGTPKEATRRKKP